MSWRWLAPLLLIACSAPGRAPAAAADLITPERARTVVSDYWGKNEAANMASDATLYDAIETGAALVLDRAQAQRYAKLDKHLARPRPLRKVTVYVPHQARYPAEFAARIDTVGTNVNGEPSEEPVSFFNLFEKPSAGQDWKSSFFADPAPTGQVRIAIGKDGYATLVPGAGTHLAVEPARLPNALADYLNAAAQGLGTDDLMFTGPGVESIARGSRRAIDLARMAGFTLTEKSAAEPGFHAYRGPGGQAVVFFATTAERTLAASRPGACLVQNDRHQFPPEVAPGSYSRVESQGLSLFIASDPPATQGKATLLGLISIDHDFRTLPADGPCAGTGPPPQNA